MLFLRKQKSFLTSHTLKDIQKATLKLAYFANLLVSGLLLGHIENGIASILSWHLLSQAQLVLQIMRPVFSPCIHIQQSSSQSSL